MSTTSTPMTSCSEQPPAPAAQPATSDDVLGVLARRCVHLLDVPIAGVMLATATGQLQQVALVAEPAELAHALPDQATEGPCADSFRTESVVVEPDLATHPHRWQRLAAARCGVHTAAAVPLQANGATFGALGLFSNRPDALTARDVAVAQTLADASCLAHHHQRRAQAAELLASQLQTALDSRVVIEQAKGMLAQHTGVDVQTAFEAIRTYARTNQLKLHQVCQQIVDGTIDQADIPAPLPPQTTTCTPRHASAAATPRRAMRRAAEVPTADRATVERLS